ncbi:MAG: AMP-binding protein, partial [Rubrivivax sp.]
DNRAPFVALDDAAVASGRVHVPLPTFFTPAQWSHAVQQAAVDTLVVDPTVAAAWPRLDWMPLDVGGVPMRLARGLRPAGAPPLRAPAGTSRITFTSGSTGDPKGVCLSTAALEDVADGVVQALAPLGVQRHLAVLPMSVLLEHVAGMMAARRHGATVLLPPLASLGWQGSSRLDIAVFDVRVRELAPDTLILLPHMLRLWCEALAAWKRPAPPSLKFVAVGGAAVGTTLVDKAGSLGLPVGEGYGLSECGSVQTLNRPGQSRAGSVGRPLAHARLRVADDGEIWVAGTRFLGYLGYLGAAGGPGVPASSPASSPSPPSPPSSHDEWPTGDLGHIDAEGFVHLLGRKSQRLITAYGRNVSPEWVESALQQHAAVAQAVVLGDGQPVLSAVLWPARGADAVDLATAVQATNQQLPDYARIGRWVLGTAAFSPETGLATANGRPRRRVVLERHAALLGLPQPDPGPSPTSASATTSAESPSERGPALHAS